ncbi:16S rRNA (uracil(1498)-N(3))-methyltransferase [Sarracenia purpurea var. burkii]
MTALVPRLRFSDLWNRPWLNPSTRRAFSSSSSSSSSDYSNQSRGGLPRFFSEVLPSSKGGVVRIQGDEFWHMTKVLRLSTKDRVELFNGKGGLIEGSIQRIDRTGLDFVALEDPIIVLPQTTRWHVFVAFESRVDRLQRVVLAAAKQCQRLHEMTLNPPTEIGGLLPIVAQSKLSFVAVAEAAPVFSALTSSGKKSSGTLIIGPEGDFTDKEVDMIIEAGATAVGLGPHRLRVETATIALLATIMLWSDSLQPLNS